jgi:hypothetical protein
MSAPASPRLDPPMRLAQRADQSPRLPASKPSASLQDPQTPRVPMALHP